MLQTIIIEDELPSQVLLKQLLEEYCTNVQVIGTASDVSGGIQLAREKKPDLVFLDIEMPEGDGFEVLKAFSPIPFMVIFVTGYDQYAKQAIREFGHSILLDYISKPVKISELRHASKKALQRLHLTKANKENSKLNKTNNVHTGGRLKLSSHQGHRFIEFDKIYYLQAQGGYVYITLENAQRLLATHSLQYYEDLLPSNRFFRCHKSFIVNGTKVDIVNEGRGGNAFLSDGSSVPVSFRNKPTFLPFLERLNG